MESTRLLTGVGICAGALITISYDTSQVTWQPIIGRFNADLSRDPVFVKVFSAVIAVGSAYIFIRTTFYMISAVEKSEKKIKRDRAQGTLDLYITSRTIHGPALRNSRFLRTSMAAAGASSSNWHIAVQIVSTASFTLASAFLSVGYGTIPSTIALIQQLADGADSEISENDAKLLNSQTALMNGFLFFGYSFLVAGIITMAAQFTLRARRNHS